MSIIQKIINERPWSSSSEFFIPFHVCIWILIILFSVWLNSIGGSETPMYIDPVDTEWRIEESKNFTVAPAYNKGAYQVINKSNIKDIGK